MTFGIGVDASLNDKPALPGWNQLFKDLGEAFRDLLERSFNSLIFTLVKYFDELFNRFL